MSWTIESNDPASDITEFKAAIKEAADKGIVLLCAFSDQGNVSASDCYPGAFDQTIMIGAATNRGGPCTWVNEKVVDLLFPGEHIVAEQRPEASSRPVSGSSVSTALAAGMVALLLHLIQLVDPGQHKKLREDMSKSLSRIANGKYIDVQEVFGFDFKSNSDWTKVGKEELKYLMRGFTVRPFAAPLKLICPISPFGQGTFLSKLVANTNLIEMIFRFSAWRVERKQRKRNCE